MFRFLQKSLFSFDIMAPPLLDFIYSGILHRLKVFVEEIIAFFVSYVLQIFTIGYY